MECPILRQEIEQKDCETVRKESYKEGKEKALLPSRFRKIIAWKAICKSYKNHNYKK